MKIILGGRASQKTAKLIQESAETGRRIFTFNEYAARGIYEQATSMGYDIPVPLTPQKLAQIYKNQEENRDVYYEIMRNGVLVDDLECTLNTLLGGIEAHTATYRCANAPLMVIDSGGDMKIFPKKETEES